MARLVGAYLGVFSFCGCLVLFGDRLLAERPPPDPHEKIARQLAADNHELRKLLLEERTALAERHGRLTQDQWRRAITRVVPAAGIDVPAGDLIPPQNLPER